MTLKNIKTHFLEIYTYYSFAFPSAADIYYRSFIIVYKIPFKVTFSNLEIWDM